MCDKDVCFSPYNGISSLQLFNLSLTSSSNVASNILRNDLWSIGNELPNEAAVANILDATKNALLNTDRSNTKIWKSSLCEDGNRIIILTSTKIKQHLKDVTHIFGDGTCDGCPGPSIQVYIIHGDMGSTETATNVAPLLYVLLKNKEVEEYKKMFQLIKDALPACKIDPVSLLEHSLPECNKCTETNGSAFEKLKHNECNCCLELGSATFGKKSIDNTNKRLNSLFGRTVSSESSSGEGNSYDGAIFKPKFGRKRHAEHHNPSSSKITEIDTDLTKEDEEKAHKSNVAKITFKTAKEQLLASNPAARRTLGASRKAKAKFVSPMIGAQEEKQEFGEPGIIDERLKHLDPKMIELIESEIIDRGTPIVWDDIAGLQLAKSVIQEAVVWPLLRPDIFTGLRRPPKGILLFGPPGTGKTLIGKCVAAQCNATFFSISASSLTSKWIGDGEKMVRALFAVARCHQPAVIFIDEIDSLLTARSDSEHEATRRIKTEFLVQFDGAATGEEDRILIVGATNRPHELDEAARRRLVKRLYIPLPETDARQQIIINLLNTENNDLTPTQILEVAQLTDGYSGADMKSLCSEAAMGPIRAVPLDQIVTIDMNKVRPVCLQDFINALQRVRPSVSQDDLGQYVKWNKTYGQGF